MIEVFGGKAAYSNFWGGMNKEVRNIYTKYPSLLLYIYEYIL